MTIAEEQFPDVFLYGSRIDARSKIVDGRLWVNTGQVWRHSSGSPGNSGTYANIRVFPPTMKGEANEVPVDLENRARVDIIKL
jgi:hypothetical protein